MPPTTSPSAGAPGSERPRRARLYQLGALLVTAIGVAAVLIPVLGGSSTADLRPGKPVPGAAQALALLAGIPQHANELGDPRAPLTLVEFGDLQCPSCAQFAEGALPSIVTHYVRSGKLLLVFRGLDFLGRDSLRAARVAVALESQRSLFQFIALMYRNQGLENSGYVTDTYLRALATAIPGVDVAQALAQRGSAAVFARLHDDQLLAKRYGLNSTPSFLLYRSGSTPARFRPADYSAASFSGPLDRLLGEARG